MTMDEYHKIEERHVKLGICSKIEKFFVWLINFVLFIVGIAQIAAGVYTLKSDASDWTGESVPKACIAMGVIVMFISFLGCCGAWRENRPMLWFYAFLLFVLILGQVGALSVAGVSQDYSKRFMQAVWDNMDADARDQIQDTYKCCSFEGDDAINASAKDIAAYNDCVVEHADDVGKHGWGDPIDSCYLQASDDVSSNLKTVVIAVAIVGGVQIVILFMTMCLIQGISVKSGRKKQAKGQQVSQGDGGLYPNI